MIVQLLVGILWANFLEWAAHKYLLHGLGKNRKSFFTFHWSNHHRVSRKLGMHDPSYLEGAFTRFRWREVCGIIALMLVHLSTMFVLPWFTAAAWCYAMLYLYLHKKCHLDVAWCKRYMPWHYRHHMGRDQDTNFNVVLPIFDYIFRTARKS